MSDLLLQTKLFKPAPRPSRINRNHLIARLNEGLNHGPASPAARLVLVSAPAGFGKTTLVAAWLDQLTAVETAWLSLDDSDNDLARFLTYLIAALQTAVPQFGETAAHLLQSPQPPAAEAILTLLINDISQASRPVILVLDDYDVITIPIIHQALAFLLEHLPPLLRLVLTTRSDPPLPLSRLRARGQVVEIRAGDLRLTLDEMGLFLNQVMGLTLTNETLMALDQRTEGWVAGLQLAALSMQGRADPSDFLAAFTGSHRFILDYLTDEVLDQRPKGTKHFLLQTAILDRMCGSLCDAVTGRSDSQATLERLERANLFLISLDQERHWYRYHHLFAEVLLNRLRQEVVSRAEGIDAIETLHRRASGWFEAHGLVEEAIRHALAVPDFERAASLVERNLRSTLHRNEVLLIRGWLAQLPPELVQSRPRLLLAHAWVLRLSGQSEAAKSWLAAPQTMTALNEAALPAEIRGELAVLRASIARSLAEGDHGLADAQQALALLPEDQRGLRAAAIHLVGVAQFRQGDTAAASRTFVEAVAVGETEDGPYMALDTLLDLASIQIRQGHLEQIKRTCQQARRLVARWSGRPLPIAGMAEIDFGDVLYEQNDLDGAVQALKRGIDLLRVSTEHGLLTEGYTLLSRARQAIGDQSEAWAALEDAENWLSQMQVADIGSWAFLAQARARFWLDQGAIGTAARWAEDCVWRPGDTFLGYHQATTLIRLRLAQGRSSGQAGSLEEAAEKTGQLLAMSEARAWWGYVIELSWLQALIGQALGDSHGAMASLKRALELAEPEGFVRLFVDEGEPAAVLLRQAHRQGFFPGYVARLLAAFPAAGSKQPVEELLPEPLSEREIEVLRLMAAGEPNQAIADRLFIAVSTVKKHVGNILVKLDTPNRVRAIARARELGLLP